MGVAGKLVRGKEVLKERVCRVYTCKFVRLCEPGGWDTAAAFWVLHPCSSGRVGALWAVAGVGISPWWVWLLSPAELQRAALLWCSWKDLIHYPCFRWTHSTCWDSDFAWFCLVHSLPVMFFKKSFSFPMNMYTSNLPDQKRFTFFFL